MSDVGAVTPSKRHAPKGPVKQHNQSKAPKNPHTQGAAKCKAHSSVTGLPCQRYPIRGGTVCLFHGGGAPQVKFKAAERLAALAPKAVQVMDNLLSREEFPTVQYQASRFVLEQEVGKAVERVQSDVSGVVELVWGGLGQGGPVVEAQPVPALPESTKEK